MAKPYVKRAPTVVQIPGNSQPIQLPVSDDSIISISNIGTVALALSTDESFNNTWPIAIGEVQPEPGIDNLWAMNNSGIDSEVLVLTYDARFPGLVAPPTGVVSSGYASLTGPGESSTPAALTQEGSFTIVDNEGNVVFQAPPDQGGSYVLGAPIELSVLSNLFAYFFNGQLSFKNQVVISGAEGAISLGTLGATLSGETVGINGAVEIQGTSGTVVIRLGNNLLGFFGVTPVAQQAAPTTLAEVISLLQAYGLAA